MDHILMPKQIEIGPVGIAPSFSAAEYFAVKFSGCFQIMHGYGDMERGQFAHGNDKSKV
jgi:hypothetical protein